MKKETLAEAVMIHQKMATIYHQLIIIRSMSQIIIEASFSKTHKVTDRAEVNIKKETSETIKKLLLEDLESQMEEQEKILKEL